MSALEDEQITAWCFVELDEDIAMVSGRSARENNSSSKVPDVSKDLNALGPNGRDDKGGGKHFYFDGHRFKTSGNSA